MCSTNFSKFIHDDSMNVRSWQRLAPVGTYVVLNHFTIQIICSICHSRLSELRVLYVLHNLDQRLLFPRSIAALGELRSACMHIINIIATSLSTAKIVEVSPSGFPNVVEYFSKVRRSIYAGYNGRGMAGAH